MAVEPSRRENDAIEIGVTSMEKFLECLPEHFKREDGGLVSHDSNKINVLSGKKSIFINTYKMVIKVASTDELSFLRSKLLNLPIYVPVEIQREQIVGNVRLLVSKEFMVYINTKHPNIKEQLEQSLDRCENLLCTGKNFSLEVRLGQALKRWVKTRSWGPNARRCSFHSINSTFCITNYARRCDLCHSDVFWVFLPCTFMVAPIYWLFRRLKCTDLVCGLKANVLYIKGLLEQKQMKQMMLGAYVERLIEQRGT